SRDWSSDVCSSDLPPRTALRHLRRGVADRAAHRDRRRARCARRHRGVLMTLSHLPLASVQLDRGVYDDRRRLNRSYLRALRPAALLQNHFIQAGIGDQLWHRQPSRDSAAARGLDRYWGWETPGALLRGHFTGHWLSAAAREV